MGAPLLPLLPLPLLLLPLLALLPLLPLLAPLPLPLLPLPLLPLPLLPLPLRLASAVASARASGPTVVSDEHAWAPKSNEAVIQKMPSAKRGWERTNFIGFSMDC
jgi:hypothetical protein